MSKYILVIALVIVSSAAAFAQESRTNGSARATSATSAGVSGKAINLQSGTRVAAQLQNALDVRRARVGDEVVLKTTEAIKANGRTIVGKGARLTGHVTQISQKSRANGESSIGLVFDQLESGSLETPINATITSITQAATRVRAGDDGLEADGRARSSSTARTSSRSSGNGGLLGGVGGTVGGVLNTTTQTAGDVVGGTTGAVGGTVNDVTKNVGGIRISQSTDASIEGGSTLSLSGDNLRLEKGTSFNLRLAQSSRVGNDN
jgi:septal ring-binding cell division protein DamX